MGVGNRSLSWWRSVKAKELDWNCFHEIEASFVFGGNLYTCGENWRSFCHCTFIHLCPWVKSSWELEPTAVSHCALWILPVELPENFLKQQIVAFSTSTELFLDFVYTILFVILTAAGCILPSLSYRFFLVCVFCKNYNVLQLCFHYGCTNTVCLHILKVSHH